MKSKNLKDLWREKGLRQNWLAEKLKVSPKTIQRWQKGQSKPKDIQIRELSKVLGYSEKQILEVLNEH